MKGYIYIFMCAAVVLYKCGSAGGFLFISPEDVAQAFTTIYGFAPRIYKGNDHRLGFGFRFGQHADLQILYEFGPQTSTRSLEQTHVRVGRHRRRQGLRPLVELLLRAAAQQERGVIEAGKGDDEPR